MPPSPLKKHPLTLAVALLTPLLVVGALWLGGHPEHLPGFLRNAFVADQQTRVVDEAIKRVAHDYYRPISPSKLSDASIAGVVASLGDRFSHYLTAAQFREFNSPPHFAGIGVAVESQHRGLLIGRVFDSSPASRAGLKVGELIVGVGGRSLEGLSEGASTGLIKGPPGTDVTLRLESTGKGTHATRIVKITRETVSEPVVASDTRTVHGVKLGLVALATFSPGAHGEVAAAVESELHKGVKGLLFDLRSNGGGLVSEAQLIASLFIKSGTIVSTRGRTQPSQTL
ncbi:MAG: S41 family peptidase, partial [Solirubrobacteraceae bacterium]